MNILITGVAGFIGYHLARKLLEAGHCVTGVDNLNSYYAVSLKEDRLEQLKSFEGFTFAKGDIANEIFLEGVVAEGSFSHVVHLAAQAGVRYSLENPRAYISSNLVGVANLLECCRHHPVEHLLFASSSSVYGLNGHQPYSPHDATNHPVSLYAATKLGGEAMAHSYSHLYGIPCTGLRFFTVYGPWGRPDMALDLFTKAIVAGEPIKVFNEGRMHRDFTYVEDIAEGIVRLLPLPPKPDETWDRESADPATSSAPWRLINIGGASPIELSTFIATLEDVIGRKAVKEYLPMQDGDVVSTWADDSELTRLTGMVPATSLREGMKRFWAWYRDYYGVKG